MSCANGVLGPAARSDVRASWLPSNEKTTGSTINQSLPTFSCFTTPAIVVAPSAVSVVSC